MKQLTKIAIVMVLILNFGCKSSQYTKLFNGKNLNGWEMYGTEKWYVKDGLLISESGPDQEYGYLATDKNHKDFELKAEFLQLTNGNSGIFFRSEIEGRKISGWQAEVAPPGPGNFTGGIYESYGRGWLIRPNPEKNQYLKIGEWNKMRLRVVGNQVTTWLNGHEMVDITDQKIGEANGKIALQIHAGGGTKIFWREIKLKDL